MRGVLFVCTSVFSGLAATAWLTTEESSAVSSRAVFQGPWHTTNRRLDGVMTCVVTRTAEQEWRGRFFGTWNGVSFSHDVAFSGPSENLRGTAVIDGAHYDWTGEITASTPRRFKGKFDGDRYTGWFDLQEQSGEAATAPRH